MPLFRKRKTLWQVKELEGYLNKLESHVPPDYDVKVSSPDHQALDKIVRFYWESLHPLEHDFIFSWLIEFQTVEKQRPNLQTELETVNKEIAITQQNSESKIEELNKENQNLTVKIAHLKNALNQKNQLVEDLTNAIQDQKFSGDELKQKLEQRIKDMKNQMIEQHKEFETSQIELGSQFKAKVIELDEEKLLLNEIFEKNRERITQLENENQDLKKKNRLFKIYQEKINNLKAIVAEIPANLLRGGEN